MFADGSIDAKRHIAGEYKTVSLQVQVFKKSLSYGS